MSNEGYRTMTGQTRKIEFTRSHDDSDFKLTCFFFFFFLQSSVAHELKQATGDASRVSNPPSTTLCLHPARHECERAAGQREREKGAYEGERGTNLDDETWFCRLCFFISLFLFYLMIIYI
jgi:hypothetical protein